MQEDVANTSGHFEKRSGKATYGLGPGLMGARSNYSSLMIHLPFAVKCSCVLYMQLIHWICL